MADVLPYMRALERYAPHAELLKNITQFFEPLGLPDVLRVHNASV